MINCRDFFENHISELSQLKMSNPAKFIIIQVGDNPASERYVRNKIKDCRRVGNIEVDMYKLSPDIAQEQLENKIKCIISKDNPTAMMVQLPLPPHINTEEILNLIPPEIDVDGLSRNSQFTPCTPKGIMMLLDDLQMDLKGKHIAILGKSELVGKPLINLLLNKQATVSSLNSSTTDCNFKNLIANADIIISAVGKRNLLDSSLVSSNQIVLDIGINFDENGKLCGDCNKELYDKIDMITPTPKGTALYTRLALIKNILGE